jgi:hypothetical protein
MGLADELERLEDLHHRGALNDVEFEQAKLHVISESTRLDGVQSNPSQDLNLKDVHRQNELARIDREWQLAREAFYVAGRHGHRYLPSIAGGYTAALIAGVFGIFWTVMAISITSMAPDIGPFAMVKIAFPLFGVIFTAGGVLAGVNMIAKANRYQEAEAEYQKRRSSYLFEENRRLPS